MLMERCKLLLQAKDWNLIDNQGENKPTTDTLLLHMKLKLTFSIFVLAVVTACSPDLFDRPENLISEDEMVKIQLDLSLIEVMQKGYTGEIIADSIMGLPYVFSKYKIDSLQLAQSETYYAKNPKIGLRIFGRVQLALDKKIDSLNRVIQKMEKEK